MHIYSEQVDERDSCWEDDAPRFRVYLHSGPGAGGATDTHDLRGGDVLQAIDWAQEHVPELGTYAVALVWDRPGATGPERGLVWLVGIDGNSTPTSSADERALRRMEQRRLNPIELPPSDRVGQ